MQFDQPDANWHARISFLKSSIRIVAGLSLLPTTPSFFIAGACLIAAEVLGIVEELV